MRQDVMTENGLPTATKPLFAIQPCPPSAPCAGASRQAVAPKPYQREQLSNAEAATLTTAKAAADGVVAAARPSIDATSRALLEREQAAGAALHRLDLFTRGGALATARDAVRTVVARHEHDGPEDRRRRPAWAKWALWLTVPAAGIYDTAFFAAVFLRLVDGEASLSSPEFYIALLPGVVITVALLVAGHWLAEALVRARAHTERTPSRTLPWRRATTRQRAKDALPWPHWLLPVVFAVLVLGTLTLWAHNRALESQSAAVTVPTIGVALLLLMFSLTAVAVKAVYHNPHADTARAADRQLTGATTRADHLTTAAGTAVADFESANSTLRGLLDDLTAQAFRRLDHAWNDILARRHEHGLAGTVAPPFAAPDRAVDGRTPLFDGLVEPPVWLTPVDEARTALRDKEVTEARDRMKTLLRALATQRATHRPDPPQATG
jgi:hypothetical protein